MSEKPSNQARLIAVTEEGVPKTRAIPGIGYDYHCPTCGAYIGIHRESMPVGKTDQEIFDKIHEDLALIMAEGKRQLARHDCPQVSA